MNIKEKYQYPIQLQNLEKMLKKDIKKNKNT